MKTKPAEGGICVSVANPDTASVLASLESARSEVDVVEIRLDAMQEFDIAALCSRIDTPLLFTNRPVWEGGNSEDSDEERITPLLQAVETQTAYIDLELKTPSALRQKLLKATQTSVTKMIISHHDFDLTPDSGTLTEILHRQAESGAHIGKIVTLARFPQDVLRVLYLQCEAQKLDFPLIAFCMGEEGKLSRVATLLLGGFMTYAALDESLTTAPGQFSVRGLRKALAAVIGK